MNWLRRIFCAGLLLLAIGRVSAADLLPPGFRPLPPGVHALVGGKVVIKPGQILDVGTVVIRDGLIEKVGPDIIPPSDARIWDMTGLTIYAGFIDPYLALAATGATEPPSKKNLDLTAGAARFFGVTGAERDPGNPGPSYSISGVHPEHRVVRSFAPDPKVLEKLRQIGFTTANVVPEKGIIRGSSAFVVLSDVDPNEAIIRPDLFQNITVDNGPGNDAYPESLMGEVATVRQSFFDAQHYALDQEDYAKSPQHRKRPAFNPALEALGPSVRKQMRVAFEAKSALLADRAARIGRELDLDFCIVSSGQEWRRPDLAKAASVPFIVPINFSEAPKMPQDDDWNDVSLDQLRAWDWAPENAALLRREGIEIALTTFGLEDKAAFRKNLRLAMDRGLSENDAVAALTTVPAKLCGLDRALGTVEAGKLANLTVVSGNGYFDADSKVKEVWIDGCHYRTDLEETKTEPKKEEKKEEKNPGPPPPDALNGNGSNDKHTNSLAAKNDGAVPLNEAEPEKPALEEKKGKEPGKSVAKKDQSLKDPKESKESKKISPEREVLKNRVARSPLEGRGPVVSPPAILITNATLWTCASSGKLENAALFVVGNKIKSVGREIPPNLPPDTLVIDAQGKNITPGIIDDHSHAAILGDVNEGTVPSSAMVRIGDVVNSEAENIRYQLAGGVTTINLLHGSANPIGGQSCIIKLRDGEGPEGLKFEGAAPGMKFALGENVKQSNWGDKYTTRFPQTRMGVQTFIANRFIAARQYLKHWDDYRQALQQFKRQENFPKNRAGQGSETQLKAPLPPRRDLELEAIGEALQGKRWIHCHAYRQDEMMMLIRLAESFGVQIAYFGHTLEGYKIADELAQAKVGGSTFADWWAYKFEVFDAIPYNGSLMRERGALVSFSSDSPDLARRLNLEAAKAVKFGGTPELEAFKFVTLNPARQLRIDARVGSLEPGKDADFAIWSKSPLDSSSLCLETWIEGKKYFDRAVASERSASLQKERQALIEKAKKAAKPEGAAEGASSAAVKKFFERALECAQLEDKE